MFAIVESNSIKEMMNGNTGITIGDVQYPADIFTKWTESELNAINIYKVETDLSNFKSIEWYNNTNLSYAYDSSSKKVKATYKTANCKTSCRHNLYKYR